MAKLQEADETYHIKADYVLKLAHKARELFESSKPMEKRLLIKMALQNLEPKGKKVEFNWIKPFDVIANHASRQAWLAQWDNFRTINWLHIIEYPNLLIQQTQKLLTLVF